jgi:uncharacterized membrane protein
LVLAWQQAAPGGVRTLDVGEWLTPMLIFVALVVVGAIVLGKVGAYMRRQRREETGGLDVLTDFRSLKQRGELTDEEFQKIRSVVSRRAKKEGPTPKAKSDPSEESSA